LTPAPFALDGRVAIVTGAAGLLGRRHCQALAQAGAHVVAADLREEPCLELEHELGDARGRPALGLACDITERISLERLLARTLERYGRVDVLVNNAGLDDKLTPDSVPVAFEDYPQERFEQSLKVNVTGTFLCCQVIGAEMARHRRGSIVNIASTYGVVAPDPALYRRADGSQAFIKSAAYPAAKAAVLGLTRYLGAYWGRVGVRVNALSPGGVENGQHGDFVARYTERTPLGRMACPGDYAGALLFLASDASAYMTGANLVVDGGFTAW